MALFTRGNTFNARFGVLEDGKLEISDDFITNLYPAGEIENKVKLAFEEIETYAGLAGTLTGLNVRYFQGMVSTQTKMLIAPVTTKIILNPPISSGWAGETTYVKNLSEETYCFVEKTGIEFLLKSKEIIVIYDGMVIDHYGFPPRVYDHLEFTVRVKAPQGPLTPIQVLEMEEKLLSGATAQGYEIVSEQLRIVDEDGNVKP